MGASAAVVGTELAVLGHSEWVATMEKEKAELEQLEKDLAKHIEMQEIKELEEQLAELELEEKIAEYQVYETEEQMLTRALRESMEEAEALVFGDSCPGLDVAAGERDEVKPVTDNMPPPPPVEKRTKPVETSTMPSPKKSKVDQAKPGLKADEIPVLSPKSQKPYQKFWSRFVATPQMCIRMDNMDTLPLDPEIAPCALAETPTETPHAADGSEHPPEPKVPPALPEPDSGRPPVLDTTEPITPAEQRKLLPKAKAKAKTKAKAKSKPSADADGDVEKPKRSRKRKAADTEIKDTENEGAEAIKKPRRGKGGGRGRGKAAASETPPKGESTASSSTTSEPMKEPTTSEPTSGPSTTEEPTMSEPTANEASTSGPTTSEPTRDGSTRHTRGPRASEPTDAKKKFSRKSAAYHRARAAALKAGKSKEEALELARKVESRCLNAAGLVLATLLRMPVDALLHMAPDCSSWGIPSRGTSQRNFINVAGNVFNSWVRGANMQVSRAYPAKFAQSLLELYEKHITTVPARRDLRHKPQLVGMGSAREQFQHMAMGDVWEDASLLEPLLKMIDKAWEWAKNQGPSKFRTNAIHGEEEVRIILSDTFEHEDVEIEENQRAMKPASVPDASTRRGKPRESAPKAKATAAKSKASAKKAARKSKAKKGKSPKADETPKATE
eukprot:Skav206068  [mRNA]  locus=scaffold288:586129:593113:- [translate_table: standard]